MDWPQKCRKKRLAFSNVRRTNLVFFIAQEWPTSITLDPFSKQMFVLDAPDGLVFRIDLQRRIVALLIGTQRGCEGDEGQDAKTPPMMALSGGPIGAIAFNPARRNLYVAIPNTVRTFFFA